MIHSRPEARNAMDPQSADALVAAFQQFDRDADAAVAVLWGEGGAFCAGWDLKYCATMVQDAKQLHEIDYPLAIVILALVPWPASAADDWQLEAGYTLLPATHGPLAAEGEYRVRVSLRGAHTSVLSPRSFTLVRR